MMNNSGLLKRWARLQHSAFRAKFVLTDKDRAYARVKGKATIDRHAHEMCVSG